MAPFKQVPSLIHSSSQILANTVFVISEEFLGNVTNFDLFTEYIETIGLQLSNFLGQNNPSLAPLWLEIAQKLDAHNIKKKIDSFYYEAEFVKPLNQDSKELKAKFVTDCLVRKASDFTMERFTMGAWSISVGTSFLNYMWKATDLKYFNIVNLGQFLQKNTDARQCMLNRLPFLTNLTEFHTDRCSNKLISILCKNCKSLESLLLGYCPKKVTSESIHSLASLKKLRILEIVNEMFEENFITLLLYSQSDNLQDILGNLDCSLETIDINCFLRQLVIDVVPFRTFNLRRVCCDELDKDLSHLIPKYFPSLELICFINPVNNLPDLSILQCFNNLKAVHLHSFGVEQNSENLLSLQIPMLTKLSIHFGGDDDLIIEPDKFLEFGLNCPNLQSIELSQCSFSSHFKTTLISGKAFQNLKLFDLCTSGSLSSVEIILSHAPNIEEIKIAACGISDEFFDGIFKSNPLRELKKINFTENKSDVSTEMLKFLIRRCPRITLLGGTSTNDKLADKHPELKKFISENNYDVSLY